MLSFLADTVLTAPEILEVLNNVHEFYNQAWDKLIWAVAGIFLIVGILLPYWLRRQQKEDFDAVKERMTEVERQIEAANQNLAALSAETMQEIRSARDGAVHRAEEYEATTKARLGQIEGDLYCAAAQSQENQNFPMGAFVPYCMAAQSYLDAGLWEPACVALQAIARVIRKLNESGWMGMDRAPWPILEGVFNKAREAGTENLVGARPAIETISAFLNRLPKPESDNEGPSSDGATEQEQPSD